MGVHTREQKTFLQVIADGSIRHAVPEGTEGAVRREYEDRETKEKKYKWELVYNMIDGMLGPITIQEGKFGDQLIVPITDGGETLTLALATNQNYGEDLMKKLPNIDMSKPVLIKPFSFESDGKKVRGLDIRQNFDINVENSGDKIANFFRDTEAKKNINGLPDPEPGTKGDDWKIYFAQVRKFLIKYNKENGFIKDKAEVAASASVDVTDEMPDLDTTDENGNF